MKIRNGFVSNSSRSSFVIRGAKFKIQDILEALNMSKDELVDFEDNEYETYDFLESKLGGFDVECDGNYFGRRDYSTLIVGKSLGVLPDGEVVELKEYSEEENEELLNKFSNFGLYPENLRTYVQMISNDNY